MGKEQKYYVVWQGRQPGVYATWPECQAQIKEFTGAKYKAFPSEAEAWIAFKRGYAAYAPAKKNTPSGTKSKKSDRKNIRWESISVDAACSGNPGVMEYQGVNTRTGERLFHQKFSLGTNNIGEFLAIVHALAWLKQQQREDVPIYTDSATALKWVKIKKCRTKLDRTSQTEKLHQIIERAEDWLERHTYGNPLLKWDTESWGEIPADFGRKK